MSRGQRYPPAHRLPWALLHVLIVAIALGAGLQTVSLSGEAQPTEPKAGLVPLASAVDTLQLGQPPLAELALVAPPFPEAPQTETVETTVLVEHVKPPPDCVAEPSHPIYCVYTVQPGDTLSGIVERFEMHGNGYLTAVEMLAQSNRPDVVSSDHIVPGQKLRLPNRTGIIVTVLSSKTLSEIAAAYGVTADDVMAVPENGIASAGLVLVGQEVLVPDPRQLPIAAAPPALPPLEADEPSDDEPPDNEPPGPEVEEEEEPPPAETPAPEPTQSPQQTATPRPTSTPTPPPTATPTPTPRPAETPGTGSAPSGPTPEPRPPGPSRFGFVWPVWGPISSYFGPSHPLGIDIDLYMDPNAPIGAAKGGIVTFAGGNACCSYGLYVIVDHGDDMRTLYAHFSQIVVVQGQAVTQGQLLGFGGRTGYATGNHLHFEVHLGDSVVDPLLFLP